MKTLLTKLLLCGLSQTAVARTFFTFTKICNDTNYSLTVAYVPSSANDFNIAFTPTSATIHSDDCWQPIIRFSVSDKKQGSFVIKVTRKSIKNIAPFWPPALRLRMLKGAQHDYQLYMTLNDIEHTECRRAITLQAPHSARQLKRHLAHIYQQKRALHIDWLNPRYTREWQQLKVSDDCRLQYLNSCYDQAKGATSSKQRKESFNTINNTLVGIQRDSRLMNQLGRIAPKLHFRINTMCKVREHTQDKIRTL